MKQITMMIAALLFSCYAFGQNGGDDFTVVFYNTENLFDTIDAPLTKDEEFTPGSEKHWNTERYLKKVTDISNVLRAAGQGELPAIIGLAEIENGTVLMDLVRSTALAPGHYKIVHEESPDERGIDVALLYRPDKFDYYSHETIPVSFPFDSTETTRDILYVKGKAPDGKELNIFVNHWSSRYGGMLTSEPKRMYCAVALRRRIDLLLTRNSNARILVMGDFNDEPTNRSIMDILHATNKRKNIYTGDLYDLFYDKHNLENYGSYFYKGNWNMLDQIMVSYNMIDQKNSLSCRYSSGHVFKAPFMLYKNKEGVEVPNRTYGGPNYYGGISDHFPVYVVFEEDEKQ
ncbi:MAG TPA: endonuclease [Bacteroidales bacterium]|nr:endonuclease [Bacteroidales bacterium]